MIQVPFQPTAYLVLRKLRGRWCQSFRKIIVKKARNIPCCYTREVDGSEGWFAEYQYQELGFPTELQHVLFWIGGLHSGTEFAMMIAFRVERTAIVWPKKVVVGFTDGDMP